MRDIKGDKAAMEPRSSGQNLLQRQRNFLIFALVASLLLFSWLKIQTDRVSRTRIPGSSIIYLPSGKYLKHLTFGYSSLVADIIYLWAIQYYGTYEIVDRFKYLEHIFQSSPSWTPSMWTLMKWERSSPSTTLTRPSWLSRFWTWDWRRIPTSGYSPFRPGISPR